MPKSVLERNSSWMSTIPGFPVIYVMVVLIMHLALLAVPILTTAAAWCLTLTAHSVVGRSECTKRNNSHPFPHLPPSPPYPPSAAADVHLLPLDQGHAL